MSEATLDWLAALEKHLRADIDAQVGNRSVRRLWELRLLTDREAQFLLDMLLLDSLSDKQTIMQQSIRLRLLQRLPHG